MFIQQLFEDSAKRIIVTYPGRFQPFHKGHAEVFANLQRQFGSENVFIVTGNKTDAVKSPFNFSDKVRFMHAMGIPNHQIIETDKVYDLPGRFEPVRDQVVFITVVGAPDASRLNPGATKKDGSQSYFQNIPQSKNEFETADKHGYVIVEPEHPETIVLGGRRYDVSHGTPTRELWNTIRDNPGQRGEFVTQLYGRADGDLANTLDKIPTGAAPAPEPAKKMKNVKKDLTKVQHDPNAEQPVAEAGNRGYNHGFASPTAPSLGGSRRREDDEYHVPDPVDTSIWYIRANGKIIKDKMGTPFQFRSKEAARKSAMTMMAKPFNAGKKFILTTKPEDEAPVTESVTHRIGLTVTDPNHPMVSKRGDTYHKTVRVTGDDREKAINGAIAHARRKGYKVHDHHYIGTVDDEIKEFAPPGGDDGNDGFSDDTLKRLAAQWYHGDEDPRVEKTLMAAGWEIGQDEGYDDEPGVFVVQAGDVNGNSYMSWPANELRQGMAETTGDKPFDNMMKTIKQGTNKQKTADRKEQQKQTQQRARDAFGNMFGGGNPADKLSIRKGVAEGTEGQVVFSGTGADGSTYEIIQSSPTDFMIHANGKHIDSYHSLQRAMSVLKNEVPGLQQGVAEAVDIGQEWISDTELDQYVPDRLQQQWRELLGYDMNGNPSALWANLTGGYEPDVNDPQHRALMVKVANKWFAAKKIPNVKFFDVKDADDELEWLVQIGQQGVAEGSELKQAKRKYNQAAKDANLDQVGAGKKIDTMKKSLRQKDVDNKKQDVNESAEELSVGDPVIISGQGIEFEGKTGDIDSFGDMKRFVVVNLYNHGKHSFHSSDVSYNDYADEQDDLDEDMYQYNREDPYNSEFAPRAGMGRMTLRGWKQQMIRRTAELAQQMAAAGQDIDKSALWDNVHAKLKSMNMDPIAQEIEQAQAELEKIRQRGGVRSRAFNK